MRPAETFLLAAGIGRHMYGQWRFRRMLSSLMALTMFAVAAAVMMAALVMVGMYAGFLFLLGQSVSQPAALLIVALALLFAILALLAAMRRNLQAMKPASAAPASDVVDAFFDGLLSD